MLAKESPVVRCEREQYTKPPALPRRIRANADGSFYFRQCRTYTDESHRLALERRRQDWAQRQARAGLGEACIEPITKQRWNRKAQTQVRLLS